MKRFWLVLLLWCAPSVFAADFMDSFSEYRLHAKRKLGINSANTTYESDSSFNQFIREGVVRVVPQVAADKEVKIITTSYRQNTYVLDTQVVGIKAVVWSKNDSVKSLIAIPQERWYEQEHRSTVGQNAGYDKRPSYYDFTDSLLLIYPPPTITGDTLKVLASLKTKNISAATDLTAIPPKYRPAVLNYVVWKVAEANGHPLTNLFKADYDQSIAELRPAAAVSK